MAYSVTTPPPTTGTAGQNVTVSWVTTNNGNAAGSGLSWYDTVYLSPTAAFNAGTARRLADFWVSNYVSVLPLTVGEKYTMTQSVFIPADVLGDQYLIVLTDNYYNFQAESNETNNTVSALIHFGYPDLVPSFPPRIRRRRRSRPGSTPRFRGEGHQSRHADVGFLVRHSLPLADFDLRCGNRANLGNYYVTSYGATLPLANGGSYTLTPQVLIPADATGDQYLIVFTDNFNCQIEESDTNNTASTPVHITRPDLTVGIPRRRRRRHRRTWGKPSTCRGQTTTPARPR